MPDFTIPFFEFNPRLLFPTTPGDTLELTFGNHANTFGQPVGSMVVTDDNAVLQDDNGVGTSGDGVADVTTSSAVTLGTSVEMERVWEVSWIDGGGQTQTTTVGQVNFDTSGIASVAIVTGPVPPQGVTLTVEAFNPSPVGDSDGIAYADIVCFTRDTKILTDRGDVAIQNLKVGDMVMTRDHGAQPLRWVGSRRVPALGHLAPIKIRKGAIGNPEALILSPAHRVLIMGWQAEALFGEPEVFITAQQLLDQDGVSLAPGAEVEYFHILLDGHEIVTANGMPCESLNPSDIALNALQTEQRDEILELFPELVSGKGRVNARPALSSVEAAALV